MTLNSRRGVAEQLEMAAKGGSLCAKAEILRLIGHSASLAWFIYHPIQCTESRIWYTVYPVGPRRKPTENFLDFGAYLAQPVQLDCTVDFE